MPRFRVMDFEDGRRQEHLQKTASRAETPMGFLRLFYRLNPKALRGHFSVRLHADGADIYSSNGAMAGAFIRAA
ncbi:hypothetical protein [Microvirga tunisiensis]|uniref:Uncharacterized protein n=1 Tax=Microvirga tunisiensis TaxID=2108360 RepID=A0A5N7MLV0_9HYPH|nr:hypothetical protein [Microvirga tunisiensis]MPR09859.1 hypothetical protein [Microvirga tunisiensis]MPR28051.1 hypothetical protein [Microvirga tunisiensis]